MTLALVLIGVVVVDVIARIEATRTTLEQKTGGAVEGLETLGEQTAEQVTDL
ncbi:hypothetical protein [Jannaschia sp. R86511]|uniref:hypothetical protein n=1 Tax=Jannaschia sp. R86511 TaxID=3093853 RepID=UPI0036D2D96F